MGIRIGSSAYLTVVFGVVAAIALLLGLWALAALALALVLGGRREPVTLAADVIVFIGLAGPADPLWVVLLVASGLATP